MQSVFRTLRGLCLALCGALAAPTIGMAAAIDDTAGMFDAAAVARADAILQRVEQQQGIPVRIETVESLRTATTADEQQQWADRPAMQVVDLLAARRAQEWGQPGLYILMSEREHVLSVLRNRQVQDRISEANRVAIRDTFIDAFARGELDAGLIGGVERIEEIASRDPAQAAGPAPKAAPAPPNRGAGGGMPAWVGILVFIGIGFLVLRLIGALMRGGRQGYPGQAAPMGGHGPGGHGLGSPGGGFGQGGRGGLWTGLFGGLGGALLGNWAYDRFFGGHHHDPSPGAPPADPGAIDDPTRNASWGEPTGGDWLGGGGAGDWGGGGGDWGGGGGDWGGDAGGGDW